MRCEVLLFAQLAEAIGSDRLTIELPEGATVAEALALLSKDHETIAATANAIAVAVNEQYSATTAVLSDGDTIALIPPVSGG